MANGIKIGLEVQVVWIALFLHILAKAKIELGIFLNQTLIFAWKILESNPLIFDLGAIFHLGQDIKCFFFGG